MQLLSKGCASGASGREARDRGPHGQGLQSHGDGCSKAAAAVSGGCRRALRPAARGVGIIASVSLAWVAAIGIAIAAGYAFSRLFLGYARPGSRYANLAPREVAFLEAAAEATFPAGGSVPVSGVDANLPRYLDRYFDQLHGPRKLQIRLLLMLVEQATFFFPAPGRLGMRRFSSLDLPQREAVLQGWSESRFFLRRFIFATLRAVLTLGYLADPATLRHLDLAPFRIESPVLEADLLYPPIGRGPEAIAHTRGDLTGPPTGEPHGPDGPIHPDYEDRPL